MEVSSLPLVSLLKNKLNWDKGQSYRVPGKTFTSQHLAVFDLSAATPIKPNEELQDRYNRIRCRICGDVIESEEVHDYRACSCGACAVDGGKDYLRRCGYPKNWEDCSEVVFEETSTDNNCSANTYENECR